MSAYATGWVWRHSKSIGDDRLVMLALADSTNGDHTGGLPDLTDVANRCRLNGERAVGRCIDSLVALGEIHIEIIDETGCPEFTIMPILNEEYR